MELSREVYQIIIQEITNKADLCSLSRVSRPFQRAAERALYNTIDLRDPALTVRLCNLLAINNRLSILVQALTVFAVERPGTEDSQETSLPEGYWTSISTALSRMTRLRFFNLHIDGDSVQAWILRDVSFKLRIFHCDLSWDTDLACFLNKQDKLVDLYLADFLKHLPTRSQTSEGSQDEQQISAESPVISEIPPNSLSSLAILECSFPDAMNSLVPGRPVTRIKTCFSREDIPGKTGELMQLVTSLRRSTKRLRTLDLADSSYTEEFSLVVLRQVATNLPDLRYLGTLVLPVGIERLQFFGLLMRLRRLHTIELEVSEWDPAPTPQALRALASELRLYCSSIKCCIFVQDFERTVVRVVNGFCAIDYDTVTENLWREV